MKLLSTLLMVCLMWTLTAQEKKKEKNWDLRGYVKGLQSLNWANFNGGANSIFLSDNLIHNRLNFRYLPVDGWQLRLEVRNRIFWGDQVKLIPNYVEGLNNANDLIQLSIGWNSGNGLVLHTMLDRAYIEYSKGNIESRIGRQRINWGINTFWNPNDIFNAYAFTDFDYEERPGADAFRFKYYTGISSSIEFAAKMAVDSQAVAGLLWQFNKVNYDFQVLLGYVNEFAVLGGGWAGNLKQAGFKGEWSLFYPTKDGQKFSAAATIGLDYQFPKGLFLSGGFLYNSLGTTDGSVSDVFAFQLSARNLYPFKYSTFVSGGYAITPLINTNLAVVYSPGEAHAVFLSPMVTYSIVENWDLDFVGQLLFASGNNKYGSPLQSLFIRIKKSF